MPSNPSPHAATPMPQRGAAALGVEFSLCPASASMLECFRDSAVMSADGVDRRAATVALDYGCVDWFIYVSDSPPGGTLNAASLSER